MRLQKARVTNYRSVRDSGWFEVEHAKTIFVGPNEAGKTALLQALQQINPPKGSPGFDSLRDFPRSDYNEITTKKIDPSDVTVVEAHFTLEEGDKADLPEVYKDCTYVVGRKLDNKPWHRLENVPKPVTYGSIRKDVARLLGHIDPRVKRPEDATKVAEKPSERLNKLIGQWSDNTTVEGKNAETLRTWLDENYVLVEEGNVDEEARYDRLKAACAISNGRDDVLNKLWKRLPVFVLFNNYFRVRPLIHLDHLATRLEQNLLDDAQYDYGNQCLLKLLGFSARELSNLGKVTEPGAKDAAALKTYRDQLDKRSYQLNAASVRLTSEVNTIWNPNPERAEADRLRITADGQYLKVVVEDDLGVEIELDQRSEGYQWLVSFFVVFFAEAADKHENAILLLDEPGLSLHGLKQREFRQTISRLSDLNQTLYSTHSPFLVGPDELDLVRVIEMKDRTIGTKAHTTVTAVDPAALLPLQEALGYDLAQSLFAQQRNLILEGLTDHWYVEATAALLRDQGLVDLNEKIALIPAKTAGKVVYYATILHAHKLKVAALLDSDTGGDQAAKQDVLVHTLGNKRILRTKDAYGGPVITPEIEDLLRETLIRVAKSSLDWDVTKIAAAQPCRPIVEILKAEIAEFSKYKLAKAYLRWSRDHDAKHLTDSERGQWSKLIGMINSALK